MLRMRQELDRERQERNSFQLECNRIQGYWEITRRELEERKAELRARDREMEEAQERHQLEIKVGLGQGMPLLLLLLLLGPEEEELGRMRSRDVSPASQFQKHEEEMSRLRSDFELQTKEMEAKYTRRMQALRDELDLRRKTEIHELEERKNTQISELIGNHEGAFGAIKNYYNDITAKNLTLINLLKEQVEELKKKQAVLEKEKADVLRENKGLAEPLHEAQEQVAELQRKLVNYYRDKEALVNSKAHLKIAQKELKDLQWEHEVLEQRFSQVQSERDDLYQNFTRAINEVQQKTGYKNLLLEHKLHSLLSLLEQKEVELSEILAAADLDPSALSLVSHKLEAHNDMLQTFEAKLTAFGIPLDNLGFQPLSFPLPGQELGKGPAGLVSVPT
ncbi:hypothetical protein EK904_014162 [Melospiza melodia maxima]|nr:hypothetical protein EK904_014162 [Melospiza melodia maxima]